MTFKRPLLSLLIAISTTPALAGFTVMDDDLFPTQAIPASVAAAQARASQPTSPQRQVVAPAQQQLPSEVYSILFRKGLWGLNEDGTNALYELLPLMQDRKITVTGRPDGLSNSYLAGKRSESIRQWLIRNGIPAAQIEMRTDVNPNTAIDNLYPVEISIQKPAAQYAPVVAQSPYSGELRSGVSPSGIRTTITPMPAAPVATPTVAIVATPPADPRLDLVRQLVIAAQAGRLDPKAALASIGELLAASPAAVAAALTRTATPPAIARAPAADFSFTATPETARPKEWLLSSERTLKDSTVEWAKKEGYEIDWRASNYFRVGRTQTLTGDLLDTIDKVSTAAGLKMEVWKKDKLIRISDRTN